MLPAAGKRRRRLTAGYDLPPVGLVAAATIEDFRDVTRPMPLRRVSSWCASVLPTDVFGTRKRSSGEF
jgi:hypothetical protein